MNAWCVVCHDVDSHLYLKNVSTFIPKSNKTLKKALEHIVRSAHIKLNVQEDANVCHECYKDLVAYDSFMLKISNIRRRITSLIQNSWGRSEYDAAVSSTYLEGKNAMEMENPYAGSSAETSVCEQQLSGGGSMLAEEEQEMPVEPNNAADGNELPAIDAEIYACEVCGVIKTSAEYLELHMNVHRGKAEGDCPYCPKQFEVKGSALRHIRKAHYDRNERRCKVCGESFAEYALLYKHKLKHEIEKNPLFCIPCRRHFKNERSLHSHKLKHRKDRRRYICYYCAKVMFDAGAWRKHVDNHKVTQMLNSCPFCDKTYRKKADIKHHIDTFHKAMEYICSICDLRARNKEYLQLHMNLHQGKTELECPNCSQFYATKSVVVKHMQVYCLKRAE